MDSKCVLDFSKITACSKFDEEGPCAGIVNISGEFIPTKNPINVVNLMHHVENFYQHDSHSFPQKDACANNCSFTCRIPSTKVLRDGQL